MSREVPISKFQNILADNCTKKITINKTAGRMIAEGVVRIDELFAQKVLDAAHAQFDLRALAGVGGLHGLLQRIHGGLCM